MKVGVKYYLLIDNAIVKIGMDMKRVFPDLANKTIPSFQVNFEKIDPPRILEIRVDPHNFDSNGKYKTDEYEMRRAATVISKALFPANLASNGHVIELKPKPYINTLTETQKTLIKERFNRDFTPNTWDGLPPQMKADFWRTGMGRSW